MCTAPLITVLSMQEDSPPGPAAVKHFSDSWHPDSLADMVAMYETLHLVGIDAYWLTFCSLSFKCSLEDVLLTPQHAVIIVILLW